MTTAAERAQALLARDGMGRSSKGVRIPAADVDELRKALAEVLTELSEARAEIERLKQEKAGLHHTLTELESELETARASDAANAEDAINVAEERDDLRGRVGFLRAQNAELRAEAELKQPAHVLAEAERLLREACPRSGYVRVELHGCVAAVSDRYDGGGELEAPTLAEAYSKLTGGRDVE